MLPHALSQALLPLQPRLVAMAAGLHPASLTPQQLLDSVYAEFEQSLADTCLAVVGVRFLRHNSRAWFGLPGVEAAYRQLRRTALALNAATVTDAHLTAHRQARRHWRAVSGAAKLQEYAALCTDVAAYDPKARWTLFKRTKASTHSPLAGIAHPVTGVLPADHETSLNNLCSAFVAAAEPPPPPHPAAYATLRQRVDGWASAPQPPSSHAQPQQLIPAHCSDNWEFTLETVRKQCTLQNTQSAPGPDAILPIFLRYAGDDCWQALATLFTFSWRFSVTPLAWREANVMALWKQAGSKSSPASYRPISMTSIIARTFEHLVHRLLIEQLDPAPAPPQPQQPGQPAQPAAAAARPPSSFVETQFGFRRQHTTHDAINFLLSNIQQLLRTKTSGPGKGRPLCPVLFLDIKKAFDRVDHAILLDRLHDAGIRGRAWLWIRSFLTGRRMRTVDGALYSDWQHIGYGVPQGCVLSPLLFLVFINTAAAAIRADTACSMVRPVLFADDAAIVPAPLLHKPIDLVSAQLVNTQYLDALRAAAGHLDRWCKASRMQFGSDKTKLLLFHAQQSLRDPKHNLDLSPYQQLQVSGFTIGLADSYTYLGLELSAHQLCWTRHTRRALDACRLASASVMRVATRAKEPSFAAVRALSLSLVPSCMYGAAFWARNMKEATTRKFQSKFVAPLRAALHLPQTTHQLGTLIMCGMPTVQAEVVKDELRFARHLHQLQLEAAANPQAEDQRHPTVTTTSKLQQRAVKRRGRDLMLPAYSLDLVTHTYTTTVPDLLDPNQPGVARRLSQLHQTALRLPPAPASLRRAVSFQQASTAVRQSPAYDRHGFSKTHVRELFAFSPAATAQLSPPIIRQIGHWTAFRQWEAQHPPPPSAPYVSAVNSVMAALNSVVLALGNAGHVAPLLHAAPPPQLLRFDPRRHHSIAPLTSCQTEPGTAFFLRQRDSSFSSIVRRCRLLSRRAYTQETRHLFQKAGAPHIDPACTWPICALAALPYHAPAETVQHVLLDCPRYDSARLQLHTDLAAQGIAMSLTLPSILLASIPAALDRAKQAALLACTNAFLDAVDATRKAAIGLLPLDAR